MATLIVGITGPYYDLPAALNAAQPGDTIVINTPRSGGGDYSHGSVWDEGLTIRTTTDVGTVQFGLTGGVFNVTGAGPSNFVIFGNANNNILTAGDGNDVFFGAAGNDTFNGGGGRDIGSYLYDPAGVNINLGTGTGTDGYGGTDTLNSIEALAGSHFGDTLIGGSGDDLFIGFAGNDTINGGSGTDTASYEFVGGTTGVTVSLISGAVSDGYGFFDTLISIEDVVGSDYNDHFVGNSENNKFYGNAGSDVIDGGGGQDTAVYETAQTSVNVNLATGRATDGLGSTDTLRNIEAITGGIFGDVLTGDSNSNRLEGLLGADRLDGGGGTDLADYSRSAGSVNVNLAAGTASDGFGSTDTLISIETVFGSNFADTLTGDSGDNLFSGLRGNDIINGGGGADVVLYAFAASAYTVTFNAGSNTYTVVDTTGVEGTDTLSSIEFLSFSDVGLVDITVVAPDPADETFVGDSLDNTFTPRDGDDTVNGAGGKDTVDYSTSPSAINVNLATGVVSDGYGDTDTLTSIESVIGSAFGDTLTGSGADNDFTGGGGNDTITGAAGTDRAIYALAQSSYTVSFDLGTGTYRVVAKSGNEGTDTLSGIETLSFSGGTVDVAIADALPPPVILTGDDTDNTFTPGVGNHTIDGRGGIDTVSYAGAPLGVEVDLAAGTASNGRGGVDTLTSIERIIGTDHQDRLTGSDGDDIFEFTSGNDIIDGGAGFDTLSHASGTTGQTIVVGYNDIERYVGTDFQDIFKDNNNRHAPETFDGGTGIDILDYEGSSASYVVDFTSNTTVDSQVGSTDTLVSIEHVVGSFQSDTFIMAPNTIASGSLGSDLATFISNGSGVTIGLSGAARSGTDTSGNTFELYDIERLEGSEFGDNFTGSSIDNAFRGRGGNDVIDGADGVDKAIYALASNQYTVVFNEAQGTFTVTALSGTEGVDTLSNIEILSFEGGTTDVSIWAAAGLPEPDPNNLVGDDTDNTFTPGAGDQTIDGRGGIDTVSYLGAPSGVTVNLATGVALDGQGGTDTLTSIERIVGSSFDDALTGSSNDEIFVGSAGNDVIHAAGGYDVLSYADLSHGVAVHRFAGVVEPLPFPFSGSQKDTISGIEAFVGSRFNDVFVEHPDIQLLDGGAGTDHYSLQFSLEGVTVDPGNGLVSFSGGRQVSISNLESFFLGLANDKFVWDSSVTFVHGAQGSNEITFRNHDSGVTVSADSNTNDFDANGRQFSIERFSILEGSAFADSLTGYSSGSNYLTGLGGNDALIGQTANDTAVYALGIDQYTVQYNAIADTFTVTALSGAEGVDTLSNIETLSFEGGTVDVDIWAAAGLSNPDPNVLVGDNTDNTFAPGAGDQTIDGRGGIDTVSYLGAPGGVTVNLATGTASDGHGGTDTLTSIERIIGSAFADNLTGSDADEFFVDAGGSDNIHAGGGFDVLSYETSSMEIWVNWQTVGKVTSWTGSGFGPDTDITTGVEGFIGSAHRDRFFDIDGDNSYDGAGGAADMLSFMQNTAAVTVDLRQGRAIESNGSVNVFSNIEHVSGSDFDDRFVWAPGVGLSGGQSGRDTLSFAQHEYAVSYDVRGHVNGTDANGSEIDAGGFEIVEGSAFNDTLTYSGSGDVVLIGLAGNDSLGGGWVGSTTETWISYRLDPAGVSVNLTGNTATDGFGDTDSLQAIKGVEGSNFADSLTGNNDDNVFRGLDGNDLIDGAGGADTAIYALAADQYDVIHNLTTGTYDVVALSGGEGTDTLRNVETLSFDGGTTDVAISFAVTKVTSSATSDFDGDGDDDVVFKLTASGNSVHNSADGTGGGWIGYADRTVIGTGDFNGDGDADLLFRFTGGNHSGFDSGGGGPWLGRSDRTAVAVGDFNGDGDDDVLFQFANGNKHIADADSGNTWVGFADRSIEAVGDFDGDGDDDVLFELNAGGYVTNNVDGTGGRWLGGPNRDVAGIGDFDGDGDDDILFVLNSGGHIINDGEGGGMQWFGFTDRSVAGIGDFDGDGNDDILFRLSDGNHTIISPNGVGRWIARTNNTVRDVGDYDGDGDDDILFEAPGGGFVVDQADGGVGLGMYFLDRTLVAGDPLGIGLTSDADLV
ncbi:hypothetical protein NBRC116588_08110 [Pyruvatibacter sp. HU-CL02332]|uniref:calcium-binding protein n=1 Tax=Pyruvatibacter sp. HU-CL02332 TaxID=3127650 RepID=UPI003107FEFC